MIAEVTHSLLQGWVQVDVCCAAVTLLNI